MLRVGQDRAGRRYVNRCKFWPHLSALVVAAELCVLIASIASNSPMYLKIRPFLTMRMFQFMLCTTRAVNLATILKEDNA